MLVVIRFIEVIIGFSILWIIGTKVSIFIETLQYSIYRNLTFGKSTMKIIAFTIGIATGSGMMYLGYVVSKVLAYIFEGIIYSRL